MGAYEELAAGIVGNVTAKLVYDTVAAVVRIHRFPPPRGADRWDFTAVQDVAHDFMARDGYGGLIRLALTASDDRSLRRLLDTAVRNHLRDIARATISGRLSRSITRRLEFMADVRRVTGSGSSARWILDGADIDGTPPAVEDLIASAYQLPGLAMARAVAGSQRGSALVDPASLDAVLRDALRVAGCPLESSSLLEVVTSRFPVLVEGHTVPLDEAVGEPDERVETALGTGDAADEAWEQLGRTERLVLPAVDGSVTVRQLAEELGISKSSAQRAVTRAKDVLATALARVADAEGVLRELLNRSELLLAGTLETGSTSSPDTGGTP